MTAEEKCQSQKKVSVGALKLIVKNWWKSVTATTRVVAFYLVVSHFILLIIKIKFYHFKRGCASAYTCLFPADCCSKVIKTLKVPTLPQDIFLGSVGSIINYMIYGRL